MMQGMMHVVMLMQVMMQAMDDVSMIVTKW